MINRIFSKFTNLVFMVIFGRIALARKLGVSIGDDCRVMITEWGTEPFLIRIGSRVTITAGVTFLTHDGSTWLIRNDRDVRYQKFAPITIGDEDIVKLATYRKTIENIIVKKI